MKFGEAVVSGLRNYFNSQDGHHALRSGFFCCFVSSFPLSGQSEIFFSSVQKLAKDLVRST